MNCASFSTELDDYLDGRLAPAAAAAMRTHVESCPACSHRMQQALRLRSALRGLPVPPPSPGFESRVLHAAAAAQHPPVRAPRVLGYALAASLAAAVGLAMWLDAPRNPMPHDPAPSAAMRTVAVAAGDVTPVRLVFRSPRELSDVTVELELPEGVELSAYPGTRALSWRTSLRSGANVLELPVVVHGGGGVLTASVRHGEDRKQFQVLVKPAGPAALAPMRSPWSVARARVPCAAMTESRHA